MKELYWDIFTEDYPLFIDKYLELPEFKRIDNIGIFCGCDYVKSKSRTYNKVLFKYVNNNIKHIKYKITFASTLS